MINIFKKIWSFIKGLLRLTKFDNKLFEAGIEKVFNQVLKSLDDIDIKVNILLAQVKVRMFAMFKKYKFITKLIDNCFKWIESKISKSKVFDGYNLEKKSLYIKDKIIEWYNNNF